MMSLLAFTSLHFMMMLSVVFIFGAIMGSFLNVIIYRYPATLATLCFPHSHCPQCKKKLAYWMNIPLFSYLFLKGHCFYCKKNIPVSYFLVEILSAIATVIVFLHFSFTLQTIEVLIFTYGLIVLSMIDYHHRILPDAITYTLLWLGMIVSTQHVFTDPTGAIAGVITGYLFLWGIAQLYLLFRRQEGLGLGDCKMMAMLGAWVGVKPLLNIVLLSSLLGLLVSLILLRAKKIKPETLIPFGPFIAIAGWYTVIYGDTLSRILETSNPLWRQ